MCSRYLVHDSLSVLSRNSTTSFLGSASTSGSSAVKIWSQYTAEAYTGVSLTCSPIAGSSLKIHCEDSRMRGR